MRNIILLVACGLALGGCSQYRDMRNPQTSQLVLDELSIPEVNRISVPMPTQPQKVAFERAEASSLWHGDMRSFFGDQRAHDVGDILTVLIDIKDQAQLRNASERKRSGTQQVADPKILGYGSKIANVLPGISQSDLPSGGKIIDLGSTSGSSGEGSIKRNETIQLKVAATIIRKLPNDNFVIAGRQEVKVNSELRELRVAGIVRPVDISRNNTVSYDKIAEARITYGGRGQISAVQKPRYGQDVMEIVLPY